MSNFTKDQRRLLLYLEDCAVNNDGKIRNECVNEVDRLYMKEWKESGFIKTGRICFEDIKGTKSTWVELSNEAWEKSALCRQARGMYLFEKRNYRTTEELKNDS